MVRVLHSWIAAGRAPPALCTHSGSLEGTNDKGERRCEIECRRGHPGGGILYLVWSGLRGRSDAQQGVLGLREVLEHQPPQAIRRLRLPTSFSSASPTHCYCGIHKCCPHPSLRLHFHHPKPFHPCPNHPPAGLLESDPNSTPETALFPHSHCCCGWRN